MPSLFRVFVVSKASTSGEICLFMIPSKKLLFGWCGSQYCSNCLVMKVVHRMQMEIKTRIAMYACMILEFAWMPSSANCFDFF